MYSKNFKKALNNLIIKEGGYVDDKYDSGKETYYGISRKYNPDWTGWEIIDNIKKTFISNFDLEKVLNNNTLLLQHVYEFYYSKYWKRFLGDYLPYIIAEELLEQSVLLGNWKTAGKQLQTALNYLNRNGKLYKDLVVDGYVGPKTLNAVRKVKERYVVKVLNGLEFCRLKKSMDNNKENERFVGWFDRV